MTHPRFSVAEYTTPKLAFGEDVALYREIGADGIGIDELKLLDDRGALELLRETRASDPTPTGGRSAE